MMTLIISTKQRVQLMGILQAAEGRRIEVITINSLLEMVTFTSSEIEAYQIKDLPDGRISWNPKNAYDTELSLTKEQIFMLKKVMDSVEQRGKLTADLLPLDTKITQLQWQSQATTE